MYDGIVVTLGAIALINLMGWLTPGPNMLVIISASASNGRRAGIMTAFGVSVGGLLWSVFAVMGAATLFKLFPDAVFMLRMAGAGYLLWLGYWVLRSARGGLIGGVAVTGQQEIDDWRAIRTGFFVIATNPKAAIFFGSIFAAFIPVGAPVWALMVIVVFSVMQATIQHCITASVFSTRAVRDGFQAAQLTIRVTFGTLYIGLGLATAYDAIRRA